MFNKMKLYFLLIFIFLTINYTGYTSSKQQEIPSNLSNIVDLYKSGKYIEIIELSYGSNFKGIDKILLLAKSYENLGYYNRAYRKYREIYTQNPSYKGFVYYFIAKLFMKTRDYSEALKWYKMTLYQYKELKDNNLKLMDGDWHIFFRKSAADLFSIYRYGKVPSRTIKKIFKNLSDDIDLSYYFLARVYLDEELYEESYFYIKKLISLKVNRFYKIDLLQRFVKDDRMIEIFVNDSSFSLIEILKEYKLYYELLRVFTFLEKKQNYKKKYEKDIAFCYYKMEDYKSALVLYNDLFHKNKDSELLVRIAYSYYYLNKKIYAKKYLERYFAILKNRNYYSYDSYFLKILNDLDSKSYKKAINDSEFVVKRFGAMKDMDDLVYKIFYLLMGDNKLEDAVKIVFLYYPHIRDNYYKSWAAYILGLQINSKYFYDAILKNPGNYYYFKSSKYIQINKSKIKIADRFYRNGDLNRAIRYYILLYATGNHKSYVRTKIKNILENTIPYNYILKLHTLNDSNSFIYRLYFLGIYNDLKDIFFNTLETSNTFEKYYMYYLLAKINYDEDNYKRGLLYAEILTSSLNYLIFLPNDMLKMLYPQIYADKIRYELLKRNWFTDQCFVMSIIREESRWDKKALSGRGAVGLMQLMPDTASWIYKKKVSKRRLINPDFNLEIGIKYLEYLFRRFADCSIVLASYNGGPTNVSRWVKKYGDGNVDEFVEAIPYDETRNFIKKVYTTYSMYKEVYPTICNNTNYR